MKKLTIILLLIIFILSAVILISPDKVIAGGSYVHKLETDYPSIGGGITDDPTIEQYVSYMYIMFLVLIIVSAFVALIIGGYMYMLSDSIVSKDEGKRWIYGAIVGIILALSSYTLLRIIHPDYVDLPGINTPG